MVENRVGGGSSPSGTRQLVEEKMVDGCGCVGNCENRTKQER